MPQPDKTGGVIPENAPAFTAASDRGDLHPIRLYPWRLDPAAAQIRRRLPGNYSA